MSRCVGCALARMLPCRDPYVAGRAMSRTFGGSHVQGAVVGWVAAARFLALVRVASRHGVVAGSAALYLELVCGASREDQTPCWHPGDIDCWLDHHTQGVAVLDAAMELFPTTASKFRRTYHMFVDGVKVSGVYGGFLSDRSVVAEMTIAGQRLQVICQRSPLFANPRAPEEILRHPDMPMTLATAPACGCQHKSTPTACYQCINKVGVRLGPPQCMYNISWPPGYPHTSFDMDIVCVAIRDTGDGLEFDRRCGDPNSKTLTVRPHALWRLRDGQPCPTPDLGNLRARLAKYWARGWTNIVIPEGATIHTAPGVIATRVCFNVSQHVFCHSKIRTQTLCDVAQTKSV
jgi:hypothetical protein